MIRTSLPKQEVFIVVGGTDGATNSGPVYIATDSTVPLIDSTNMDVNLLDGQVSLISAEFGQTTPYGNFIPTASATVGANRYVQLVQGTPNSSNLSSFRGRYNRHQTVIRSAVLDGGDVTGFSAEVVSQDYNSAWTISDVTVDDETEYMFHFTWRGEKNLKFYNRDNVESISISYKTPNYTSLSTTSPSDHMYMNIAHEINLNSKLYAGISGIRRPSRKMIALCVDKASGTQGTLVNTLVGGLTSVSVTSFTTTGTNWTVGDVIRATATNGGGTGATVLLTVASLSTGAIATVTSAIENVGHSYTGTISTWSYAIVSSTSGSASLTGGTKTISGTIATAATSVVVEYLSGGLTVTLPVDATMKQTLIELMLADSNFAVPTTRIVPINVTGATVSGITTAGANARVDALVIIGLDWDSAAVIDEARSNKARLMVGMDETALVQGTVSEKVKPFIGSGSGARWKAVLSKRRYDLSQYTQQSLPVFENFIEVPNYIDASLKYKAFIIENAHRENVTYSHINEFPKRVVILVPSTFTNTVTRLETLIGAWLASVATAGNMQYKETPTSFSTSYFA